MYGVESYVFRINNAIYKTVNEIKVRDNTCLLSIGDTCNILRIYADVIHKEGISIEVYKDVAHYYLRFGSEVMNFPATGKKIGEYEFYIPVEEVFNVLNIPAWITPECGYVTSSILYSISFERGKDMIVLSVSDPQIWRWKKTGDYTVSFIPRMQTFISETISMPVSEAFDISIRHDGPMLKSIDVELTGRLRFAKILTGNEVIIAELERSAVEEYNSLPITIASVSEDEETKSIEEKICRLLDGRILKNGVQLKVYLLSSRTKEHTDHGIHIILAHDRSSLRRWQGVRIFYYPYSDILGHGVSTADLDLAKDIQRRFFNTSIDCLVDKEPLHPLKGSSVPTVLLAFYLREMDQSKINELSIATIRGIIDFLEGGR